MSEPMTDPNDEAVMTDALSGEARQPRPGTTLDAAWAAAEGAIRPGVVRAISIGQYPDTNELAGQWVALLVYEPSYYGNGRTPAAALCALATCLRGEPAPKEPA